MLDSTDFWVNDKLLAEFLEASPHRKTGTGGKGEQSEGRRRMTAPALPCETEATRARIGTIGTR